MLSIVVSGRPHLFWQIQQCQLLRGRTAERCHASEGCDLFNCMIRIYQDRFLQHTLLKKNTVVYINESISFDIDMWIENCTLSQLGYQKVSWKADRLVMLSSMLGNSEGQWLLHLRQAEKVRAVIGSIFWVKLKIPKCSKDVWIDRVFLSTGCMMILNDLYI